LEPLKKYLHAFQKLHIDRSHGIAPHKPILLLSILQLYQDKKISNNRIFLTPELVATFKSIWSLLVITRHDCRISYPFYYMKSEIFWKLIPRPGFENIDQMGSIVKSFASLNSAIDYAEITEDLCWLMNDPHSNLVLQQHLLNEYFPATKSNFCNSENVQLNLFSTLEDKILHEDPAEYKVEIENLLKENDEEEIFLRGSIFKREIPKIYNYTCCISGMKINTVSSVSMVDACHIVPFSQSYDDTINNGITLCPNLHRAFDRGLISIDDNYQVKVSGVFNEEESCYSIRLFEGRRILLPSDNRFYPSRENLDWHLKNVFKEYSSVSIPF
jgi:putative restriction endonuclease